MNEPTLSKQDRVFISREFDELRRTLDDLIDAVQDLVDVFDK